MHCRLLIMLIIIPRGAPDPHRIDWISFSIVILFTVITTCHCLVHRNVIIASVRPRIDPGWCCVVLCSLLIAVVVRVERATKDDVRNKLKALKRQRDEDVVAKQQA